MRGLAALCALCLFGGGLSACGAADETATPTETIPTETIPTETIPTNTGAATATMAGCRPQLDPARRQSVPRQWIEANLDAIRRDVPAPTVHARNLWHLSAAMWDSHAAYAQGAVPYFDHSIVAAEVPSQANATPPGADLTPEEVALSYAAHTLLSWRYGVAVGSEESLADFDGLLAKLCLPPPTPDRELVEGTPEWVGRRIANHIIEFGLDDGSAEANGYVDLSYQPVNEPLIVDSEAATIADPNRWQPLQLTERVTQNGIAQDGGLQVFIGSNWGWVESFALPPADDAGITIEVAPPPMYGEQSFIDAAVEVIDFSDRLGGQRGARLVDIGPASPEPALRGAAGSEPLAANPFTGVPYAPNIVPLADYGRVIAEYWADGPDSETPPGHWNTIAIAASDRLDELRWGGAGPELGRHEWDLRLFFVLNGALHDAAIAVWGTKRAHDYVRPISIVRHLGAAGELPEIPGLVERVTDQTRRPGQRHDGLPLGALVVRTWMGPVADPNTMAAGVGWRPAEQWRPYQRATFVSPAFAAYVSGHSGFSRAGAEVLIAATGSPFFPGGMLSHTVEAGELLHEEGPTVDVELQWATYRDAADEAGISRRYGGIHVRADDLAGRALGAEVGRRAWDHAQQFWSAD